jgi:hypothetical protein
LESADFARTDRIRANARMRGARGSRIVLLAAAVLAVAGIARLSWRRGFWPTATPFDRWPSASAAIDFRFLSEVADRVPAGAAVVALTNPPDLEHDFYLHAFAVALLPGRRVLAGAMWGASRREEALRQARYVLIVGSRPEPPPGTPILELPAGSVWRRP